jgi:hypothetical protein
MPFHKTGTEFADFVEKKVGEITAISTEVGLIK